MNTNTVWRIGLSAAVMLVANRCLAASEPWRTIEQPELKQALEKAPVLTTEANHRPLAVLNGDTTRNILRTVAKPGQMVSLSGTGSIDPDGNALAYEWFVYREAGTFGNELPLRATNGLTTLFVAPNVKQPATIHAILRVSDNGQPPLCSYRRMVVTMNP